MKEKERYVPRETSVLNLFKSSSLTRASPRVQLDNGDYDLDATPTVQAEVSPL